MEVSYMASHLDPVAWRKKVRRRWIISLSIIGVLLAGGLSFFLVRDVIIPAIRYSKAESCLEKGDIPGAIDGFAQLWTYKDSNNRAAEIAFKQQEDPSIRNSLKSARRGDILQFGSYEQDNDLSNGPEPIDWFVLAKGNGRILVLACSILDHQAYNSVDGEITWDVCSLRAWLNGFFLETAFTEKERLLIPITEYENLGNPASTKSTKGGEDTWDRVSITSADEMYAFYRNNPDMNGMYARATPYAAAMGVDVHKDYGTSSYWIRTPGVTQAHVVYCDMIGGLLHSASPSKSGIGVRPIIWLLTGDSE